MTESTKVTVHDFLEGLGDKAAESLRTPVEIEPVDIFPQEDDIKVEKTWLKIDEVVAVACDLKNSTALNFKKHPQTSARLYEAVTANCVAIVDRFNPDWIDIQGDGLFALYHGDKATERALCAAITLKTFGELHLVPAIEDSEHFGERFPETGLKVGMASGVLAVKKVGIRGENDPVWAGKPVNWAWKCAQAADGGQLIATQSVYGKFADNEYVTHSCSCNGQPVAIWVDETVDKLPDSQIRCKRLTSRWCVEHGDEFCEAILDGQKTRGDMLDVAA